MAPLPFKNSTKDTMQSGDGHGTCSLTRWTSLGERKKSGRVRDGGKQGKKEKERERYNNWRKYNHVYKFPVYSVTFSVVHSHYKIKKQSLKLKFIRNENGHGKIMSNSQTIHISL